MRGANFLRQPPPPTSEYDIEVRDAFVRAGRNAENIEQAYQRLGALAQDEHQRAIVDDYYNAALRKAGGIGR